jgi:magnesium transporter
MLKAYAAQGDCLTVLTPDVGLEAAVWIDLVNPTREEEKQVESLLGVDIPTREEMQTIELSSRIYRENGSLYLTGDLLARVDQLLHSAEAVTFVLSKHRLVTIRYDKLQAFELLSARCCKPGAQMLTGERILTGLLQTENDYLATVLGRIGLDLDEMSRQVFSRDPDKSEGSRNFREVLLKLGRREDLMSHVRDSLNTMTRMVSFLRSIDKNEGPLSKDVLVLLKAEDRNVAGMADYLGRLSQKMGFLLEATLGLVNVEQNQIIKIFSVAAVALMPPTLVASIYGMNFKHMPELEWIHGYPMAIGLMITSAVLPLLWFKRKRWL